MRIALLLIALVVASSAHANEPPPPPPGGINFTLNGACKDNESGLEGMCYAGYGTDGTFYLTFYVDGQLQFIRTVAPDASAYETIWVRDTFNTL